MRDPRGLVAAVPGERPAGYYTVDDTARSHNAYPDEETQDGDVASARFALAQPTRYRDGLLPT